MLRSDIKSVAVLLIQLSYQLDFSASVRACFCVIFGVSGCMLRLVYYLFIISTSVVDCLGRFVSEMTYYV